jgi:hypothetical protein
MAFHFFRLASATIATLTAAMGDSTCGIPSAVNVFFINGLRNDY